MREEKENKIDGCKIFEKLYRTKQKVVKYERRQREQSRRIENRREREQNRRL